MRIVRTVYTTALFLIVNISLTAQVNNPEYFQSPLDIPLYLSGNFGELRSTHFHAGLDFKTQAVVGKKVFAAAEGYVSRIKVQTGGYGRSVYISHPNGLTTVYAHLLIYNDEIEKFVKDYQYRNQTHQFDLYLKQNQIRLQKGEVIGLSGNSGSSGGPHLHFEIRETSTQRPLNGLLYNFNIRDNIKPSIRGISLYPMENASQVNSAGNKLILNAYGNNGVYNLDSKTPIELSGKVGFGIETYDYLNGSANRCGIYSIEMLIDSTPVYLHEVVEIGFDEAGYIKSHVDYAERMMSGRKFQKMQTDPNNKLKFYQIVPERGFYEFPENRPYHIHFKVKDSHGNLSTLSFYVKGNPGKQVNAATAEPPGKLMSWSKENNYENDEIRVYIPQGALFDDFYFQYDNAKNGTGYSKLHKIHNKYTPLNKNIKIYLKSNLPTHLQKKALIAEKEDNGKLSSIGGSYEYGYVTATTRYFGNYVVEVDTVAPGIVPVNIYPNANLSGKNSIDFKVSDNLSGIKSYNGYIDNEWVLFEYDPKNDLVQYFFDKERLNPGEKHSLELFIMDEKDNITTYSTTFVY